jgi:hypothetical protein
MRNNKFCTMLRIFVYINVTPLARHRPARHPQHLSASCCATTKAGASRQPCEPAARQNPMSRSGALRGPSRTGRRPVGPGGPAGQRNCLRASCLGMRYGCAGCRRRLCCRTMSVGASALATLIGGSSSSEEGFRILVFGRGLQIGGEERARSLCRSTHPRSRWSLRI